MKEFKFACPQCSQHILAAEQWVGRKIQCPSCKKEIVIPQAPATPASQAPRSEKPRHETASKPLPEKRIAKPAVASQSASAPAEASATPPAPAPGSESAPVRIAVLTPEVKLQMVQSVRRRIADEASWIPGLSDGTYAYAAKEEEGRTVLVDAQNPTATRFSLLGAFVVELHERNVARAAPGRKRLLDQEIIEAIREVLTNELTDEQREEDVDPLESTSPMSISHAQCLKALDVLEDRYSQRMDQTRAERARRKLGTTRLGDLVPKLEKKGQLTPEEVATALYHEVMDLRRRLDRIETKRGK